MLYTLCCTHYKRLLNCKTLKSHILVQESLHTFVFNQCTENAVCVFVQMKNACANMHVPPHKLRITIAGAMSQDAKHVLAAVMSNG